MNAFILYYQVVLSKHVSDVGEAVVQYIRFPLLSPEELANLESENKKDGFIPVSWMYCWVKMLFANVLNMN